MNKLVGLNGWWQKALLCGVLASLLLISLPATALDPKQSLYQLNCRTWARQNGLPASGVNAITQTKDGYLWLGSAMGLARFDGSEFKLFNFNNIPEIRSTIVKSLSVSARGGLWFGLERGAFGYCDGQKISFMGKEALGGLNLNVQCVHESTNGDLWIAAETQTSRMNKDGKFETMLTGDNANERYSVNFARSDSQGRIWLGTVRRGLYCWQNGVITEFPDKSLEGLNINSFVEDRKGQIWVGTERGLICYDAKFQKKDTLPWPWYETKALLEDSHGTIWAGTSGGGLVRDPGGAAATIRNTNGLADDFVTALFEDQEGSLWVGTRNGLSQLSSVKIPTFGKSEGLSPDIIVDVTTSRKGGLWLGTSSGFAYFNNSTPQLFSIEVGLTNAYIKRLFEASNGDLYLLNGSMDVEIFSEGKVVARYPNKTWPMAVAEDDRGVVVGVGGELFRAGTNYYEPYDFAENQKPSLGWVFNLFTGKDGSLWVACDNGICRIKDNTHTIWPVSSKEQGREKAKVMWVFEDDNETIWGGGVSGITRLKDDKVITITRDDGLFDNIIYAIVPDDHDLFWVDSSRGLFSVSRQSLNDFADRKAKRVTCTAYDGLDAVKTSEKNQQAQAGCKTLDGHIWFPTSQGVVMIDPPNIAPNPVPPNVKIQRVQANGDELDVVTNAIVPPGRGELAFHYAGVSFIAPEKIQYRYKLEGFDQDWVDAGVRRSVFYANLKPGKYRFLVQACNGDGIWNKSSNGFSVELQPHFYQTAWFKVLALAAAIFALAGIFAWRVNHLEWKQRQLQQTNELLENKVAARTRELANSNKTLLGEIEERRRAQAEVERIQSQLMDTSRRAGQAEVASNVLHNVGNVLNSVNVSTTILAEHIGRMKIENLCKAAQMLEDHAADPGPFLTTDPKGKLLPHYFVEVSTHLRNKQLALQEELKGLTENVSHIKEIVSMQQTYARVASVLEKMTLAESVEAALKMHATAYARHAVKVIREFQNVPPFLLDKHKVLQILVNIIHNAKHACDASPNPEKIVTVRIKQLSDARASVEISDNGMGIAPENLTRIFSHGFTTRKEGHGFGLHSAALAANEIGGSLSAHSDGPGKGATFTLELPIKSTDDNLDVLACATNPPGSTERLIGVEKS